ncbi:Lipoprotein associated domain [Mycoplasmopsis californica]|uniref:Lipoprotein 17-related variable surface protein n=1 Tax=Mycoplasmopsis equigenitalium TaxID=114883 RepID=A0ABY5J460_9BACT|nr:lipoprotein 17-related variable surface protein [Mycoplasmopsis equigenitalium]UUD36681.1 lipoprotein 17-related variable surface protein [Mycoplasmopsis equigenitalium]VEU69356.1 Lipoprotein associated domain [Mycoplasmopsis californica]
MSKKKKVILGLLLVAPLAAVAASTGVLYWKQQTEKPISAYYELKPIKDKSERLASNVKQNEIGFINFPQDATFTVKSISADDGLGKLQLQITITQNGKVTELNKEVIGFKPAFSFFDDLLKTELKTVSTGKLPSKVSYPDLAAFNADTNNKLGYINELGYTYSVQEVTNIDYKGQKIVAVTVQKDGKSIITKKLTVSGFKAISGKENVEKAAELFLNASTITKGEFLPTQIKYDNFEDFKNDAIINTNDSITSIEQKFGVIITNITNIGEAQNNDDLGTKTIKLLITQKDNPSIKKEVLVTIKGYNTNAKDMEKVNAALAQITDDKIEETNEHAKLKPSLVQYVDVQGFDEDLPNVHILKLRNTYKVIIEVVKIGTTTKAINHDDLGTKEVKIRVSRNNSFKEKTITISGYNTADGYKKYQEMELIAQAKARLTDTPTIKNTNDLASETKYTLYQELDDDIAHNLRGIEAELGVNFIFDVNNYAIDDDVAGTKTIKLKIVAGDTTDSTHTFKITNFKPENIYNKDQVDLAFANLNTEASTINNTNTLPEDVTYNNLDLATLVADTVLAGSGDTINLLRVQNTYKVELNVTLKENTLDGRKILNVVISRGTGANKATSGVKEVVICGYKTKAKADNEAAVENTKNAILQEYSTKNTEKTADLDIINYDLNNLLATVNDPSNTLKPTNGVSIKINAENNDDGFKILTLELSKGEGKDAVTVTKDIKIINYLTAAGYDEKLVDDTLAAINKKTEDTTKTHQNEFINDPYNSDLALLDADTTFNLQKIASETGTTITFTTSDNPDGTKTINVSVKRGATTKTTTLKITGFQTEQDHNDLLELDAAALLITAQETINNKTKQASEVKYLDINAVDTDIALDLQNDVIVAKGLSGIQIVSVNNGDGVKTLNLTLTKGNVSKSGVNLKITGFRTAQLAANYAKVESAINQIISGKDADVSDFLTKNYKYKDKTDPIATLDAGIRELDLNQIAQTNGVTLTISEEKDFDGYKLVTINVTCGDVPNVASATKEIKVVGFKTQATYDKEQADKADIATVAAAKSQLQAIINNQVTINNKDYLPEAVTYVTLSEFDEDIAFDINSLMVNGLKIELESSRSNNDLGTKEIELLISKGVGSDTITLTVSEYLTTAKNDENKVNELINLLPSSVKTLTNKGKIPSAVNYNNELAKLDADTGLNLVNKAVDGISIIITSDTEDAAAGQKNLVLTITKDATTKTHNLTISGFKTTKQVEDENTVNQVLGLIQNEYVTKTHTQVQAKDVNYERNFTTFANDTDTTLLSYLSVPYLVTINIINTEENHDGFKNITLQVTKGDTVKEKQIKVTGYATQKDINTKLVTWAKSQLLNTYTSNGNENKLPSAVTYSEIQDIINNTNLVVDNLTSKGVKVTIQTQQDTESGTKTITLNLSVGNGADEVTDTKVIKIEGFKTKAKDDNEKAVESAKNAILQEYSTKNTEKMANHDDFTNEITKLIASVEDAGNTLSPAGVTVRLITETNHDGYKLVSLELSKGNGEDAVVVKKENIKINGYMAAAAYNEKQVDKAIAKINLNKEDVTKSHLNEYINDPYNNVLASLDADTTFNLQGIASETGTTITFTTTDNTDGTKTINVRVTRNATTQNTTLKVTGFQTKQDYDDLNAVNSSVAKISAIQANDRTTTSHKNTSSSGAKYSNINELDTDITYDLNSIITADGTTISIVKEENNDDRTKIVHLRVTKGKASKEVKLEVLGYQTKEYADAYNKFMIAKSKVSRNQTITRYSHLLANQIHYFNGGPTPVDQLDLDIVKPVDRVKFSEITSQYNVEFFIIEETSFAGFKTFKISITAKDPILKNMSDTLEISVNGFATHDQLFAKENAEKVERIRAYIAANNNQITKKYKNSTMGEAFKIYTKDVESIYEIVKDTELKLYDELRKPENANVSVKINMNNSKYGTNHGQMFMLISFTIQCYDAQATETISVSGFMPEYEKAINEAVKSLPTTVSTINNKSKLPSATNYSNNLTLLDADTGLNLSTKLANYSSLYNITFSEISNNDAAGTKEIEITFTDNDYYNHYTKTHRLTITGFTTTKQIEDEKTVNEVINLIENEYVTINNKEKQAKDVNYHRNFTTLANDTNPVLLSYLEAPKSVEISIINTEDNHDGFKNITLQVTKGDSVEEKQIKVTGYATQKDINTKLVAWAKNQLLDTYTSNGNENKLPNALTYNTIQEIVNNTNLVVDNLTSKGVKVTIQTQQDTESGTKTIALNLSVGSGADEVTDTKVITIEGFKTKAKDDNEKAVESAKNAILQEYSTKNTEKMANQDDFANEIAKLIASVEDAGNTLSPAGVTVRLITETNHDGYKLVSLELSKGNGEDAVVVKKENIKINSYMTAAAYDAKQVDKAIAKINLNKEDVTKSHLNEYINDPYNNVLASLDADTTFNLQGIASETGTTITFTTSDNPDGTKTINVSVNRGASTQNTTLKVTGFQTKQDYDDLQVLEAASNLFTDQVTINNQDIQTSQITYQNLQDVDDDTPLNIQVDIIEAKALKGIEVINITNEDGYKLVNLRLLKGNVTKEVSFKVTGFRTALQVLNHNQVAEALAKLVHGTDTNVSHSLTKDYKYTTQSDPITTLDAGVNEMNLAEIIQTHGVSLVITNEADFDGYKVLTIKVSRGSGLDLATTTKEIKISGFKTNAIHEQELRDEANRQAVAQVKTQLQTIINNRVTKFNKDKLPSTVTYTNINKLDEDIDFDLLALMTDGLTIRLGTTSHNDDAGSKTIELLIDKGAGSDKVSIEVTGYLTTTQDNLNKINELISSLPTSVQTQNHKGQLLSTANYNNDLAALDADTAINLSAKVAEGFEITIVQDNPDEPNGQRNLVISIKKGAATSNYNLSVTGFKTTQQINDENAVNTVVNTIKAQYDTISHKSQETKDVTYNKDFNTFANDTDTALLAFLGAPQNVEITVLNEENFDGYKNITLQISKGNAISQKQVKVTGFLTKKQANAKLLEWAVNELANTYTSNNKKVNLPSEVTYATPNNIVNDTDLLLDRLEARGITFSITHQENTDFGTKIITLGLSVGEGANLVTNTKQITIEGFKTKAKANNELAVDAVLNEIKDGKTSQFGNLLVTSATYNNSYKELDADLTNQSWDQAIATHGVTVLLVDEITNENIDEGTKQATLQVRRGTGLDAVIKNKTITISGFIKFGQKDVNDTASSLEIRLNNNGAYTEQMYHINDPSQVKQSDIHFVKGQRSSQILDAKYHITIISTNPRDDDRLLEVTYKVSAEHKGTNYTSHRITKTVATENPGNVINRVFAKTEFGYAKMEIPLWAKGLGIGLTGIHFHLNRYPNQTPAPLEFGYVNDAKVKGMRVSFEDWQFTREKYLNKEKPAIAREFVRIDGKKVVFNKKPRSFFGDAPVFGGRASSNGGLRNGMPYDLTLEWTGEHTVNWQLNVNVRYEYRGLVVYKSLVSGIVILDGKTQDQFARYQDTPGYGYYPFWNNDVTKQDGKFVKDNKFSN